jgi:hypothetical protein
LSGSAWDLGNRAGVHPVIQAENTA